MGPEQLLDEYRRAGALCMPCRLLPSDRDGIPNVLVEAMAAGAPVVATAVSGIPELVEHEVNGLLVAPEDPRGARGRAAAAARRSRSSTRRLTAGGARDGQRALRRRPAGRGLADLFRERWRGERSDRRSARAPCCASTSTSTATARWPRPSPRAASRSPARRASWASSPTGCTPTCPTTRSGGSTGSSSITGSTSRTRSAPPATGASSTPGSGSSRASCSRSRPTTTPATSPRAGS